MKLNNIIFASFINLEQKIQENCPFSKLKLAEISNSVFRLSEGKINSI